MKCPVDNETLMMTERQGVEIDYCPRCRGIWLDRGELDKLIEKASQQAMPPVTQPEPAPARSAAPPPPPAPERAAAPAREDHRGARDVPRDGIYGDRDRRREENRRRYDHDDDDDDRRHGRGKRGRLNDFLGDIFDF